MAEVGAGAYRGTRGGGARGEVRGASEWGVELTKARDARGGVGGDGWSFF